MSSSETSVDLTELFSKQPDLLTEEETWKIISVLRTARDGWELEKVAAQQKGKRSPRPSAGISAKTALKNSALDDLFNDPEIKSLMEEL